MAINDDLEKARQAADAAKQSVDGLNDGIGKSSEQADKLSQLNVQ